MTHMKTTGKRKGYIKRVVNKLTPAQTYKLYRYAERLRYRSAKRKRQPSFQ